MSETRTKQVPPDLYLRVPGEVRKQWAEMSEAERAEERKRREQEKAQREALAKAEREAKEQQRQADRERIKQERIEADRAEDDLREALIGYEVRIAAADPKEREQARQRAAEALRAVNAAQENIANIERRLAEAKATLMKAEEKHAEMREEFRKLEALAQEKLPEAKARLAEAWEQNEAVWAKMPATYRKKHRDRELKNFVKKALGITTNGGD